MADDGAVWFQDKRFALKSTEELTEEHARLRNEVTAKLKPETSLKLHLSDTKQDLLAQINASPGEPGIDSKTAIQALGAASASHNVHHQQRSTGARGLGASLTRALVVFAEFLDQFSGFIEVAATAGLPYAEVGYQTLSMLLFVVVRKSENESRLLDHLRFLNKSLPRLDNWVSIYPTDDMRHLVSQTYSDVVEFSRSAIRYYSRFWTRLALAVNPFARVPFDESATAIHKLLGNINAEAMYGLHVRSRSMMSQIEELVKRSEAAEERSKTAEKQRNEIMAQNKQLIQEQKDEMKRQDARNFAEFGQLLKIKAPDAGCGILSTKAALMEVFPNPSRFASRIDHTAYKQMSRQTLYDTGAYQKWQASASPCLLFLSGSTDMKGKKWPGVQLCWLSPAAIYIAEDAEAKGHSVVFYSCRPEAFSPEHNGFWGDRTDSLPFAIGYIIYQLVQRQPDVLRDNYEHFRGILDSSGSLESLMNLFGSLLLRIQWEGTLFIVFDRVDSSGQRTSRIMDLLAKLLADMDRPGSPLVKICVVAESSQGNGGWQYGMLPNNIHSKERLFVRSDWDQWRLATHETSRGSQQPVWDTNYHLDDRLKGGD